MPAYNFKLAFAESVQIGEKAQTIRKRRKRPTQPGDTLYLYAGMRSKRCRMLRQEVCTEVVPIDIEPRRVVVDGEILDLDGLDGLARADGFDSIEALWAFFDDTYGLPLIDQMCVVRWDPFDDGKSWDVFPWPDWVPEDLQRSIEKFWFPEWGRGPEQWLDDARSHRMPRFGQCVRMKQLLTEKLVTGRFVYAWNNIGRLVTSAGDVVCVSNPGPLIGHQGRNWQRGQQHTRHRSRL